TLSNVNGINDLPGMKFSTAVDIKDTKLQANVAIPQYYEQYEKAIELPIIRPVRVHEVIERKGRFLIRTDGAQFSARGLINAKDTWITTHLSKYTGCEQFNVIHLNT